MKQTLVGHRVVVVGVAQYRLGLRGKGGLSEYGVSL